MGEYVAACVAGVMSLEDALALIALRGRLMQTLPPGGAMAAVLAGEDEVAAAVRGHDGALAIAAVNAPDNVVISGAAAAVDRVVAELAERGVRSRSLNVSHAFHSPRMDPVLDAFTAAVERVTLSSPRIALVSNVTGRLVTPEEITTATYWRRHLRGAVRFAAGVDSLRAAGVDVFVEIGPTPALLGLARRGAAADAVAALPSLRPGRGDWQQMLESLAALYVAGADVDWAAFDRPCGPAPACPADVPVPARALLDRGAEPTARRRRGGRSGLSEGHPFAGRRMTSPRVPGVAFELTVRPDRPAFLADHAIHGTVVFPGTAYLEAVRVAAGDLLASAEFDLEGIAIRQPMVLDTGAGRVVQVLVAPPVAGAASVEVFSRPAARGWPEEWQLHAVARAVRRSAAPREHARRLARRRPERCAEPLPAAPFYERLTAIGLDYGPTFRGVRELWSGEDEAVGLVEIDPGSRPADYKAHPALLDACLHVFGAAILARSSRRPTRCTCRSRSSASSSSVLSGPRLDPCVGATRAGADAWIRGRLLSSTTRARSWPAHRPLAPADARGRRSAGPSPRAGCTRWRGARSR